MKSSTRIALYACVEPIECLGLDLAVTVARGDDLDREIGPQPGQYFNDSTHGVRSCLIDESRVRRPDRIRIASQDEPGLSSVGYAGASGSYMDVQ